MTNNDIARKIVDRMTEVIDKEGYLPWTKPWADAASVVKVDDEYITITAPVRFWSRSGKAYTGVNPHILALSGHTGEFITFNQAKAEGGKVRKGAKGWPVVYWSMIRKDTGKVDADGNPVVTTYPMLKYYTVFSIDDVDGLETKHHPETVTVRIPVYKPVAGVDESSYNPAAESIIAGYLSRSKTLELHRDKAGNRAFYSPAYDSVTVPTVNQFREIGEFYSTLFHELGHSTGHSSRLNRFTGQAANAAFGSEEYSKEELVAEITAASILSLLGLESGNTFRNSAAYVKSWSKHIKDDPMMFVSAAGKAEKAINLILGPSALNPDPETPDPDDTPDPGDKPETDGETKIPEGCEAVTVNGTVVAVTHTEDLTGTASKPAPAFPKREDLKPLSFSYRIGSSSGQACFSLELLENAGASTLKVIYPMIDGIENAEERKNAWFTLTALAYYKAAENPEKRPAFRSAADLYREKTGEDFPTPETEDSGKPSATKTVTAACKRIYSNSEKGSALRGILTSGDMKISADANHAVFLRSASLDLPAPELESEFGEHFRKVLEKVENAPRLGELPLPTAKELKTWIKTCPDYSRKNKNTYNLCGMNVNAEYLLNILEALPGCIAYRPENKISAILFISGEDRGILCPKRPEGSSAWTAEELAA